MDTESSGLILLNPGVAGGANALVLSGSGRARYRAAEVTARLGWKHGQWFLSYTRSRSQGDLNDFSGFLGNYPSPLIRPNVFSNTSTGLPNRFLAWGSVKLAWQMQIMPIIEYRNGLAYAQYDALGNSTLAFPTAHAFPTSFRRTRECSRISRSALNTPYACR